MNSSDDKLKTIQSAVKGNKEAFYILVSENKNEIYKMAYLYTHQSDCASDIFQNTVYRAFKSIKKLKDPLLFNTWLMRITINCCRDFLKKKKQITDNELQGVEEDFDPIAAIEDEENVFESLCTKIDIQQAMEQLDISLRTVILLRFYKDLSLAQISEVLECPLSTVKTRLYRALTVLRDNLQDYLVS